MNTPFGEKAIFIWQIEAICGGDPGKITQMLVDAHFEAAYLHSVYLRSWRTPERIALARALQAADLQVYASCGVYGSTPSLEGQQAADLVNEYHLDGFIADAESGFDSQSTPDSNAVHLLTSYKANTLAPVAWCWWSHYQSVSGSAWHPVKVLQAAMQYADVGMPMAYPTWGDAPAQYVSFLETTWQQWRAVTAKPLVAAGRAYIGDSGTPNRENTLAFEQAARALGAVGVVWWSMQHAVNLPDVWQALCETKGFLEHGETAMWTKNAIGLYTSKSGWTNKAFNFIVGYAGGNWSQQSPGVLVLEPNPELKPMELQARAEGKMFLALWNFDVDYYRRMQFDASDAKWPVEKDDYPLQALIHALENRDIDGLIVRVMNRKNLDGGDEMMRYVSFAASKFITRANKWLYTTKGLNKWTFVLSSDDFMHIDGGQENFYGWTKEWWLGIEQPAMLPLASGAWPQDSDRIRAVPPSLGWKLWFHYSTAGLKMMMWNGDDASMRSFLGVGGTLDTIPPSTPGSLEGESVNGSVVLTWQPATDAVGVEGYGIWRDGTYLYSSVQATAADCSVTPGAHTYEVDAFDKAGNHSARASVEVIVSTETDEDPELEKRVADLESDLDELRAVVNRIQSTLRSV